MKYNNFNVTGISRQHLSDRSKSISASAKRDITELQAFGVTLEVLTSLDEKRENLRKADFVKDVMAKRKDLTLLRTIKGEALLERIGLTRSQLSLFELNEDVAEKSVLHTKISNLSVEELLNLGQETRNFLRDNQLVLATYGITEESVTTFDTLVNEYEALHNEQTQTTIWMNNYTSDRLKTKSELLNITNFVSSVGKAYWKRKDKSRYGDYVLNKQKSSSSNSGQTIEQETATTTVNSF